MALDGILPELVNAFENHRLHPTRGGLVTRWRWYDLSGETSCVTLIRRF